MGGGRRAGTTTPRLRLVKTVVEFHPQALVGFNVSNAVALASRCGMGRNCSYRAVRRKE